MSKRWSRNYDSCQKCNTIHQAHEGKGLCIKCYFSAWWKINSGSRIKKKNLRLKFYPYDACKVCNVQDDLVIHHRDQNKKNNNKENLVVLCRSCHGKWHKYLRLQIYFKDTVGLII